VTPIRAVRPRFFTASALSLRGFILWALVAGPGCAPIPTKPKEAVLVSGTITDRLGGPIPGATVDFYPASTSLGAFYDPQRITTDSTGSYALELAAGPYRLIIAPPTNVGFDRYYDSRVEVSQKNSKFDYVFQGFHVMGRVIGSTGTALTNAAIYAQATDPLTRGVTAEGATGSGAFSLLLPAGTYTFLASPDPYSGFPTRFLDDFSIRSDTTFDIPLGGDPVTGIVSGPGGVPLSSLLVSALGSRDAARDRTDSDGRYTLYVRPGGYHFRCQPTGTEAYIFPRISTLRAISSPTTLNFDLSGVEWTGTVRSSVTLLPINGVNAHASPYEDAYYRLAVTTTDAAGRFRLVLELGLEYNLSFHSPGTADLTLPEFVAANDTTFDILLDPAPVP
jgi:carboxypeptidase family protein